MVWSSAKKLAPFVIAVGLHSVPALWTPPRAPESPSPALSVSADLSLELEHPSAQTAAHSPSTTVDDGASTAAKASSAARSLARQRRAAPPVPHLEATAGDSLLTSATAGADQVGALDTALAGFEPIVRGPLRPAAQKERRAKPRSRGPKLLGGAACAGYFPFDARASEGQVTVQLEVTPRGSVSRVRLLDESPQRNGFGAAARACAKHLRFEPAHEGADASSARAVVKLKFSRGLLARR